MVYIGCLALLTMTNKRRDVDWVSANEPWRMNISTYAEILSKGRWIAYDWIAYILREIQWRIIRGNARIIVNAPPRHGKTEGISHWLPTWYLDWFPEKRIMGVSYGERQSVKSGRMVRDEFQTNPLTVTKIRHDKSNADEWLTTEGHGLGGMRSAGLDGTVTGQGADLMLIDDPHKNRAEASSPTMLQHVIDTYTGTLRHRLEPDGSIIIIQTRWNQRDLTGYLLEESDSRDEWLHIVLPAVCDFEQDPIGRKIGEALCPERWPLGPLGELRRDLGAMDWAGIYQQHPSPAQGGIIKRDWFQRWSFIPHVEYKHMCQSWDLTFSDTGQSYVVGQVWQRIGSNFYLLDQLREKLDFPGTVNAIRRMSRKHPEAVTKYIEDKANGPAVISTLRDEIPGIVPVSVRGSKEARLAAVSGLFEAGNVWIPEDKDCAWVKEFIEELVIFPNSRNNDQVDTASQALFEMRRSTEDTNFRLSSEGSRISPWEFADARVS